MPKESIILLTLLAVWILIASGITAILYVIDKRAAIRTAKRIPERTLLQWSAFGGWPGAWITGKIIRHKTKKVHYRVWFAICVTLNITVIAAIYVLWQRYGPIQ